MRGYLWGSDLEDVLSCGVVILGRLAVGRGRQLDEGGWLAAPG